MYASELQERWLEDKQDREMTLRIMNERLNSIPKELQDVVLHKHYQEEISTLRWFIDKLISKLAAYEKDNH